MVFECPGRNGALTPVRLKVLLWLQRHVELLGGKAAQLALMALQGGDVQAETRPLVLTFMLGLPGQPADEADELGLARAMVAAVYRPIHSMYTHIVTQCNRCFWQGLHFLMKERLWRVALPEAKYLGKTRRSP